MKRIRTLLPKTKKPLKESNRNLQAESETQKATTKQLKQKLANYATLWAKYEDLSSKYEALCIAQKNASDTIRKKVEESRFDTLESQKR